jgi:hypothetical protein
MKILQILTILIVMVPSAFATIIAEPLPYPQQGTNQMFYTVIFDNEGEAAVAAKIQIQNTNTLTTNRLTIEIPGNVRLINAIQEEHLNEIDYNYRYRNNFKYHPVRYTTERLSKSTIYTFTLPIKSEQFETTTLILYYKATYADKSMGIWYADFETAKFGYDIHNVRTSINVIPELKLKGTTTRVDYQPNFAVASVKITEAAQSAELSDFSRNIEYSQGYTKRTQVLDPWESFHVEAEYSESTFLLYKGRISGMSGIILILAAAIFFFLNKIKNKKPCKSSAIMPIIISFISAIIIYTATFTGLWLIDNLGHLIGYGISEVIAVMIVLFGVSGMIGLVFGPPLYYGIKKGVGSGMLTFGATILWLLLFGIIVILFLFATGQQFIY